MEKSDFPSPAIGQRWICHIYLQMYTEISERGMSLQAIIIVCENCFTALARPICNSFAALIFNEHSTSTNAIKNPHISHNGSVTLY